MLNICSQQFGITNKIGLRMAMKKIPERVNLPKNYTYVAPLHSDTEFFISIFHFDHSNLHPFQFFYSSYAFCRHHKHNLIFMAVFALLYRIK